MRRHKVTLLTLGLLLAAGLHCGGRPGPGAESAGRAGILLVTLEGWWSPGAEEPTVLAELFPGSVALSDAVTPCPQVRPAVAAALTGLAPDRTGVRVNNAPLGEEFPMLPETLRQRGYATAAFVSNPLVGYGSGLERGFELFDAPGEIPFGPFRHFPRVRPPADVAANFASWIDSLAGGQSFFAWIHLSGGLAAETPDPATEAPSDASPDGAVLPALRAIAEALLAKELPGGLTVFLTGTAGHLDPDRGRLSGYFLNPEVLRTPLVYRPAAGPGPRADRPVWLPDIAATAARAAGAEWPAGDGQALDTPVERARPRFAWSWIGALEFGWPAEGSAIDGPWMLVQEGEQGPSAMLSWPRGEGEDSPAAPSLAGELARRSAWWAMEDAGSPTIPEELLTALTDLEIEIPEPPVQGQPVPRVSREQVMEAMVEGRRLAVEGKPRYAGQAYQRAAELDPTNYAAFEEAGEIFALFQMHRRATPRLEQAIGLQPFNGLGWHWMGHVAYIQDDLARAELMWHLAELLEPDDADLLYDLACAHSIRGDLDGAEAYLRRAWKAGYRDENHIQADLDLRNLREDARFAKLMQEIVR